MKRVSDERLRELAAACDRFDAIAAAIAADIRLHEDADQANRDLAALLRRIAAEERAATLGEAAALCEEMDGDVYLGPGAGYCAAAIRRLVLSEKEGSE